MQKTHCIIYTNENFRRYEDLHRDKFENTDLVDSFFPYRREWIETTEFYNQNKKILDMKRGNGYWLWKPFILLTELEKMNWDDILVYQDAGDILTRECFDYIKKELNEGNQDFLFRINFDYEKNEVRRNKTWTKKDCFVLMDCDEEKYWDGFQVEAGTLFMRKTAEVIEFIKQWLDYCSNELIITDSENTTGQNDKSFIDHRHDQSILSNLVIKYKYEYDNELTHGRNNIATNIYTGS